MMDFRTERDSMGEVRLPAQAYYGAQTQRAVENFPISGQRLPAELIHALGQVKWAAAVANRDLGRLAAGGKNRLDSRQVEALIQACREVADGRPVPRGRLPDRLGHLQQHECQRGDRQSGHRDRRRRSVQPG
jgi:fumarate hydratase class II